MTNKMQTICVGDTDEDVVMGYVVIDTPFQHWEYWDSTDIVVIGKKEQLLSRICRKAHGLLRYTKCFVCRQQTTRTR
jgi:hypothetical protein